MPEGRDPMKLRVGFDSAHPSATRYTIEPESKPSREEAGRLLTTLSLRIAQVARRELGDKFISVTSEGKTTLSLAVKARTSSSPDTKFKLRSLIGWIELFDSEQRA